MVRPPCPWEELYSPRGINIGDAAWQELSWVCPVSFAVLVAGASGQAGGCCAAAFIPDKSVI